MSTVRTRGQELDQEAPFKNIRSIDSVVDTPVELKQPDTKATELSPKDVLIGKLVEIKTRIDGAKEDVDKRQQELALYRDEILRLQGAYKSLIEYGVFLNYLEYDEQTQQLKATMDN